MCLYSWQKRKKATKDIECYKIFVKTDGVIRSRYYVYRWKFGEIQESQKALPGRIKRDGEVTSGYFHSYNSLSEAKRSLLCYKENEILCKCIIPKGSYYYYGIHSDGHEGYASKKLKITEIISEYNG